MAEEMAAAYVCGEARLMTVREEQLFCVSARVPFGELDAALGRLIPLLDAAREAAGLTALHQMVFRYLPVAAEGGSPDVWQMDVGVQVTGLDWVKPAGEAHVVTLPALRCAAMVHWGSMAHVTESYTALDQAIAAAGLRRAGEGREWNLHFQGDESEDTIMLFQLAVTEPEGADDCCFATTYGQEA